MSVGRRSKLGERLLLALMIGLSAWILIDMLLPSGPARGERVSDLADAAWVHRPLTPAQLDGQVRVYEFWSTTCGPCVGKIPWLSEQQQRWGDQVRVVGITPDVPAAIQKFIATRQVGYSLVAGSDLLNRYNVRSIPHAVVIDRTGHVAWSGYPDESMTAAVDDLLRK